MWAFLLIASAILAMFLGSTSTSKELQEICHWETFNASCGREEVILMESAHFGRMKVGRCLATSYYVGCYADVMPLLDDRCSGKHECNLKVLDDDLLQYQPCRKDLMSYLEASYTCISVPRPRGCPMDGYQELTSPEGYILLGGLAEVGVFSCPWQVHVQAGQKVEFSAYDFHSWRATQGQEDSSTRAIRCKHTLTFDEAGHKSKVHVCSRSERLNHVFTSDGHIVRIYLQHHLPVSRELTFILRYKAIGCADLPTGAGMTVTRPSAKTAMITCNRTKETWHLVCRDETWIGELRNCSDDSAYSSMNNRDGLPYRFHYGILIAIALGLFLGILLGIVMLLCMMTYKRRRRHRQRRSKPSPLLGNRSDDMKQGRSDTYYLKENNSVVGVVTTMAHSDTEEEKRCYQTRYHEAKEPLSVEEGPDVIYSPRRGIGVRCQAGCVACNGAAALDSTIVTYGRLTRPGTNELPPGKFKIQNIEMSDLRKESIGSIPGGRGADSNSLASL